jgi:VWFA-related protein
LREADAVAVYRFNESLTALLPFTADKEAAKRAVLRTRAEGRTALLDAIAAVAREISIRAGKKAVIVFTDGQDNASVLNLEAAMTRARNAGVPVYTVAQGGALKSADLVRRLKSIAALTGAVSYAAHKSSDIEKIFTDISANLRHTYMLAYKPLADAAPAWRSIQVSVAGLKSYRIRAKEGYVPE